MITPAQTSAILTTILTVSIEMIAILDTDAGIPVCSYNLGSIKRDANIDKSSPPAAPNNINPMFFFFNFQYLLF